MAFSRKHVNKFKRVLLVSMDLFYLDAFIFDNLHIQWYVELLQRAATYKVKRRFFGYNCFLN